MEHYMELEARNVPLHWAQGLRNCTTL